MMRRNVFFAKSTYIGIIVLRVAQEASENIEFFEWPSTKHGESEGICFLPVDLGFVNSVREYMEKKAQKFNLSDEETYELCLICDELLSNAIIATYNRGISEHVVLRYKFLESHAIISVLDYGGGFDLGTVEKELPDGENLNEFMDNLRKYRGESVRKVKVYGREVEHPRFGRGLRIVSGLADSIILLFHNSEGKLGHRLDEKTIGTLISVRYQFHKLS